jgi:hypothetical protein
MRYLFILLASICFWSSLQAQDLSGNWKGYFVPNNEAEGKVYTYELTISENNQHQLIVTTLTKFPNNITAQAIASGLHTVTTGQVSIHETHFEHMKLQDNLQACLMSNYLEYSNFRAHEILQGSYMAKNSVNGKDCGGGTVYLEKSKPFEKYVNSNNVKDNDNNKEQTKSIVKEKNTSFPSKVTEPNQQQEIATIKKLVTSNHSTPILNTYKANKPPTTALNNVSNTVTINENNKRKIDGKLDTNPTKNTTTNFEKSAIVTKKSSNVNPSMAQVADQTAAINKTANFNKTENNTNEDLDTQNASVSNEQQQGKNFQIIPWVLVGRENKLVKKIITHNTKISIDLYDNGTIDNDTILVYDNKQLVIDKKRLSYKAIHLDINFNENNKEHEVIIVAQNMGTVPPNTALLVLKDGSIRQEYFITSTNKMNAKLLIEYVPPTDAAKAGQP